MKRMISLTCFFLCFLLLLSGCGNGSAPDDAGSSPSAETQEWESALSRAPDQYDLAFSVKINPHFILYLLRDEVLAYEALNDEASQIEPRCVLSGRLFRDALKDIVRFSYEEGYLKDGGQVSVTIVRAYTDEETAKDLLKNAESAVLETAGECGITLEPVVVIESSVAFLPPEESSSSEESSPSQSSESSPQNGSSGEDPAQEPSRNDPDPPDSDSGTSSGPNPYESESRPEEREPLEGCPVCGGTGYCDRCHGRGRVVCDECGGTGYVTCSKCWGAGVAGVDDNGPKTCDQCGGHGIVIHENCAGTGEKNCPGCHGIGTCSVCHGSGYNPHD